jgi:hypothetical protein
MAMSSLRFSLSDPSLTPLELGLLLACGLVWTVTYVLLILQAHRSRLTGMPYFAVCLNITWELLFALLHPHPWPQRGIDLVWLALDLLILTQTLRLFPYHQPPLSLSFTAFALGTAATLLTLLAVHWSWAQQLDEYGAYSSFVINLFMSVAFVVLLMTREPRGSGQSLAVGVGKLLGTACSSAAFYLLSEGTNALLNVLFIAILLWDAAYVGLLLQHRIEMRRREGAAGEGLQPLTWLMASGASAGRLQLSQAPLL